MALMGELPYVFVSLYRKLTTTEQWLPYLWFAITFLVMFIPTFLLGMLFPCVVKLFQNRIPMLGRLAGDVYAVNTLGAILGSFLAGFVFIPMVGIQNSVMAMVYLNFLLGLALISVDRHLPRVAWVIGVLVLALSLSIIKPSWNTRIMSSGVFLHLPFHAQVAGKTGRTGFYSSLASEGEVVFYKEGITATVTVEKENFGTMALRVNGRKESGERFMRTQVLIGHIPLLLSKDPKDVLIIGWGSGATVGSVTQYPVQHVKAVELEPAIIEATQYFEQVNQRALQDPKVETIVNDGRNYLLVTPEQFDVIISQPSLPWITGASNLFTREFFQLGASRLRPNGVFGQWLTNDAIQLEDFKAIVKAFDSAFEETWIFQTHIGDVLLLGFKDAPSLDLERIQDALNQPNISNDLKRVRVQDPYDLLSLYLIGGESVKLLLAEAVSNTDDNAYIEFFGPRHFYASRPDQVRTTTETALLGFFINEIRAGQLPFSKLPEMEADTLFLKLADACLKNDRGPCAITYAEQSLKYRETAEGHYIRGKILLSLLDYMESAAQDQVADAQQREKLLTEIVTTFQKALELNPAISLARFELGRIYFKRGDLNAAEDQYLAILKQDSNSYEAHVNLGAIYLRKGKLQQGLDEYQKVLPLHPQDPEIYFKMGLIYARMTQFEKAIQAYETTLNLTPTHPEAHYNLALASELTGQPEKAVIHFQKFLELAPSDTTYASYRRVAEDQLKRLNTKEIKSNQQ
jgi:spermidine synthase